MENGRRYQGCRTKRQCDPLAQGACPGSEIRVHGQKEGPQTWAEFSDAMIRAAERAERERRRGRVTQHLRPSVCLRHVERNHEKCGECPQQIPGFRPPSEIAAAVARGPRSLVLLHRFLPRHLVHPRCTHCGSKGSSRFRVKKVPGLLLHRLPLTPGPSPRLTVAFHPVSLRGERGAVSGFSPAWG